MSESPEDSILSQGCPLPGARGLRRALDPCPVQRRILARAELQPAAVAAVDARGEVTYGVLAERVLAAAGRLRQLGVAADEPVAIWAGRSVDTLVALLAVLEAGAAFLPLDPEFPQSRLELMLRDAGARFVIRCDERTPPAWSGVCTVDVGPLCATASAATLAEADPHAERLAYILFTSGSTGRPKGVMIPHAALVNLLDSMAERPGFAPGERLLALTSPSFDISILELLLPLMQGGTVEIVEAAVLHEAPELAQRIDRAAPQVVQATPSTWRMLLAAEWKGCAGLRLLSGGERLSDDLAAELLSRGSEVWNLYGPTETTIWSCAAEVRVGEPVALGEPILNTSVVVCDPTGAPCPPGEEGELCIGGRGLARGYRGRPGLTAQRFVPHPAPSSPGERIYRTGDLVRFDADRLRFLGRIDHQIKIRGYRIEAAEVEAVLCAQSGIDEAVVVAREDVPGSPTLVAYVGGVSPATPEEAELRRALERELPPYMVPAVLVRLPALPLTPNRKVDRKALPPPHAVATTPGQIAMTQGDPVWESVQDMWCELLELPEVGAETHFFRSGGDSILATRLLARLRRDLGIALALRDLLATPRFGELVRRIHAARDAETATEVPIRRVEGVVASRGQHRLWALSQRAGRQPLYVAAYRVGLEGTVDARVLAIAMLRCIERHETLRTAFDPVTGEPSLPPLTSELSRRLPIVDLTALPGSRRAFGAERLARVFARCTIELARPPLLRGCLLRVDAQRHHLLLSIHHVAFDAWSLGVLLRDLGTAYRQTQHGGSPALPPPVVRFSQLADWQRRRSRSMDRLQAFHRHSLAGLAPLELPTDRPRAARPAFRGARRPVCIPAAGAAGLGALSRRVGATPYASLLTAWVLLLHRLSNQDTFAVGVPFAGRELVESEDVVGFFVQNLVVPVSFRDVPTGAELVARVQASLLDAFDHRGLPFEDLVAAAHRGAPPSDRSPVFQTMFTLDNLPVRPLDLGDGVESRLEDLSTGTAKFDLLLHLDRHPDGMLAGQFEYDRDLFDDTTVERWVRHFVHLVAALTARPEMAAVALPMLEPALVQQVLREWNDTGHCVPEGSLAALVTAVARRDPLRVAVATESGDLTYGELAARSERLARHLLRLGIRPEERVGLWLDRSPEAIIAMLGVLMAGGAYMPLALDDPPSRVERLLREAGVSRIITRHGLGDPPAGVADTVVLDEVLRSATRASPPPLAPAPGGDRLAYVMFTSGSTGRPKGVAVSHRNVVRLVHDTNYVEFGSDASFLAAAPMSFDASTFEIWGALTHGARVTVLPPRPFTAVELGSAVERFGVTHLWLTAGLFHEVVDAGLPGLGALRFLLAGGDVLSPDHVRRAHAALPDTVLVNGYGPTEATTFTCCHPMRSAAAVGEPVSLGRPIAGTDLRVLGVAGRSLPPAVDGELWIGGEGLARGYLGRPGLTADRFRPHPDPGSGRAGERLYRSGDLVRWTFDGRLRFIGRTDLQVKLRGFRVEPGEIEAALRAHRTVRDAAVVVREEGGSKRLCAWVVPSGPQPEPRELETSLRRRLPEHLVPSRFELVSELPLTSNGKVDRRALANRELRSVMAAGEPPRGPVETTLAELWRKLLGAERIGRSDDFFRLGGDSLQGVRLARWLTETYGVNIPLARLFELGSVQRMAAEVEHLLIEKVRALSGDELLERLGQ